jgi:predicted nucleotidyltransferase component of viral defense system
MILSGSFSKEWIDQFRKRKEFSKVNPPILEKMIHALSLLGELKLSGMEFILKGGSSLILLLEQPGRFSVDIDILATHPREELEKILDKVIKESHFTKYELDKSRSFKEGVPKAHYAFSYQSELNKKANYILLDILFETSSYPEVIEAPIKTRWLKTDKETIFVKVPSVESITGEKLTAFAPKTTGILYRKGKELEIAKQLFDLGVLFDKVTCFKTLRTSFLIVVEKEIAYRELNIGWEDVLDDIIETGLLMAQRGKITTEPQKSQFRELQNGIMQFKNYLITGVFRIDEAIEAAAKAAYMAAKIKTSNDEPLEIFTKTRDIGDYLINDQPYNYLNKLKKLPNGALFYWNQALKLYLPSIHKIHDGGDKSD